MNQPIMVSKIQSYKFTACSWLAFSAGLILAGLPTAAFGFEHPVKIDNLTAEHPVSVVEADIYVNRFRTTMRLKCFAEDLELLQAVEPLDSGFYDLEELNEATDDHADYLAEKITVRDKDGNLLKPRLTETRYIQIPEGEQIKAGSLMEYTIGFVLEFVHDEPQEFITIQQNMVAEGALLPSEFKVLLKQAGSDVPYTKMMKPMQPETFRFDWDNPALRKDDSDEDWEEWVKEQREKNLGIQSYSSIYSFIYITDFEVRHEVLVPLATLTTMIDIERDDVNFLEIEEQDEAAERIKEFFSIGNPVEIDGIEVQPVFDRVDFYGLDLTDFAIRAEKRKVSMASGRVGLIMSYSTKGSPTDVKVTWDKFNDVVRNVDGVVIDGDEVKQTRFSMFLPNNTYHWEAPDGRSLAPITRVGSTLNLDRYRQPTLDLPIASFVLLGGTLLLGLIGLFGSAGKLTGLGSSLLGGGLLVAALICTPYWPLTIDDSGRSPDSFELSDDEARGIFTQLHKNLFRAFDYHGEEQVYDALANSVEGDLLEKLYLDIRQSLKVESQGGAIAKIEEVTFLDGEQVSLDELAPNKDEPNQSIVTVVEGQPIQFGYRCQWELDGTIEHWGHIHRRETKYEAEFKISLVDDAWKITDLDVINEDQGVVKVSTRKF